MLLIDDYRLEYKLGSGSFAEVYYTSKKNSKEIFATKRIEKTKALSEKMKNYFLNEIDILKNTKHPNIIKLNEMKSSQNNFYLIMEYCNGGNLAEIFEKHIEKNSKPFPETYVQQILKQISCGLFYLHKSNIIHRDLKLENILLHYENIEDLKNQNILNAQIKIIDFGFAKYLHDSAALSSICGSPINMDPVILKALANKQAVTDLAYNEKADIWSLGVMVYTMLIGRTPFVASNVKDLYQKINEGNYNIPKQLKLSKQAISLMNGLLQFETNERLSIDQLVFHEFLTLNVKDFEYYDLDLIDSGKGDITLNNKQDISKIWDGYKIKNKNIKLAQIKGNIGKKSLLDNDLQKFREPSQGYYLDSKTNVNITDKNDEERPKQSIDCITTSPNVNLKEMDLLKTTNENKFIDRKYPITNPLQSNYAVTSPLNNFIYKKNNTDTNLELQAQRNIINQELVTKKILDAPKGVPSITRAATTQISGSNSIITTNPMQNIPISNDKTLLNNDKVLFTTNQPAINELKMISNNKSPNARDKENFTALSNREVKEINNPNPITVKINPLEKNQENVNTKIISTSNLININNTFKIISETPTAGNKKFNGIQVNQIPDNFKTSNILQSDQNLIHTQKLKSEDFSMTTNTNLNSFITTTQENSRKTSEITQNQDTFIISTTNNATYISNNNQNNQKIISPSHDNKHLENKITIATTGNTNKIPIVTLASNPTIITSTNSQLNGNVLTTTQNQNIVSIGSTNTNNPLEKTIPENKNNSNINNITHVNSNGNTNKTLLNEKLKAINNPTNRYITSYQKNLITTPNDILGNYTAAAAALKSDPYKKIEGNTVSYSNGNLLSKLTDEGSKTITENSDIVINSNNNNIKFIQTTMSNMQNKNYPVQVQIQNSNDQIKTNINNDLFMNNIYNANLNNNKNKISEINSPKIPANVNNQISNKNIYEIAGPIIKSNIISLNEIGVEKKIQEDSRSEIKSTGPIYESSIYDIKGENNLKIISDLKRQIDMSLIKFTKLNENNIKILNDYSDANSVNKLYKLLKDVKSLIESGITLANNDK